MKLDDSPIQVAIVEDNIEIASFWKDALSHNSSTQCLGMYSTAEEAERFILSVQPDVALIDIGLPGKDGIALTQTIKESNKNIEILICTVFNDSDKIINALKAGATGYILKDISQNELIASIVALYHGQSVIDPLVARKVVDFFQPKQDSTLESLTIKEEEILKYIANGYSNQEIANIAGVSINTIKTHIKNIYIKLQINSRVQAARKFLRKRN